MKKNEVGIVFTANSVKRYVFNNTYVGMTFYIRRSSYDDELKFTIDKFYPHIITAIDGNGQIESFTYMEMYWILHNKYNEREVNR